MIVEFMGCTGAGKSTLAAGVARRLREDGRQVRHHHSEAGTALTTFGNALRTPLHVIPMLLDWPRYARHWLATWRAMRHRAEGAFWLAARAYAAVRILGTHAYRTRASGGVIRIVDEGLLVTAHLAFSGSTPLSPADLNAFVAAVPLPDIVVWVDAPLEVLVKRTLRRRDPPRELRHRSPDQVRACLANVRHAYGMLAQSPRVKSRLLHAWTPSSTAGDHEIEMDRVADAIRTRLASWPA